MSRREIVVGDIHGCFDELERLLELLEVTEDDLLVSVGDLVDRGPDSLRVCDLFRARDNAVVVMGNHERKHVRGILTYAQEIVRLQMGDRYDETVEWMAGFPYYLELESAIVVHGGFEHDVPLADQREEVLAGSTSGQKHLERRYGDRYWPERYRGEKPIIFGHHVVGDEVESWGRVYGIDTGACHGGRLSAVVLPELRIASVEARRDYWSEQKRRWQAPVLAARPWPTLPFEAIERELDRAERRDGPGVAAVVAAVRGWLEALSTAEVAAAIDATVHRLIADHGEDGFARAAGAHPAGRWLFRHRNDPVGPGEVAAGCTSPQRLIELAAAVGLSFPRAPSR